mmetsp:Transcript_16336/g.23717  ORF Transcript_16336/g.23717 Transcript_16336/m.23717 type:complete len:302 (-) Transcript_16336:3666-4571(-)
MAVWQNHLNICLFLVKECDVDPFQTNDFACGAVHWLGIVPKTRAGPNGASLLPLVQWLSQKGLDFNARQRQNHTALHKADWGGHLALVKYLHQTHDMMDDVKDEAGNLAADLADMAQHAEVAQYLRRFASLERHKAFDVLGILSNSSSEEIRAAYLAKAKDCHPDRQEGDTNEFHQLRQAYQHLTLGEDLPTHRNPSHCLSLMLTHTAVASLEEEDNCFAARLASVVLEYGTKCLALGSLVKKWNQIWPDSLFPKYERKSGALRHLIESRAPHIVTVVPTENGTVWVHPKPMLFESRKTND